MTPLKPAARPKAWLRPPIWLALLLVGCCVPCLCGQAKVELDVSEREAFVNESLIIELHISNFKRCETPQIPDIPNCSVGPLNGPSRYESSHSDLISGKTTRLVRWTYSFELTPRKAGTLVIPPVSVDVDGKTIRTKAVRLPVRASDSGVLLALEVTCPRERIYVGQRVRLTLTIWVKPARAGRQTLSARDMWQYAEVADFGPFAGGEISVVERERETAEGTRQTYYAYEVSTDYVPDRPGRLTFDDIRFGIRYPTRFGSDVFRGLVATDFRRLRAEPQDVSFEIIPVPTEDRPPGYNGAVGTFDFTVGATPTTVRVGDPIELSLDIRGDGPIAALPPPMLASNEQLMKSFRVPSEALAGQVDGSSKRFTQVIRANSVEVTEIPSLEYVYFDPDLERFTVARSDAIPLTVIASETLETNEVSIAAPQPAQPTAAVQALDGLRGNETSETALLAVSRPIRLSHVVAATFVPPVIYLVVWGGVAYARNRGGDLAGRRRQGALRTARRRIDQARKLPPVERGREINAALSGYLADRLNEAPARFLGKSAVDYLADHGVAQNVTDRWTDVIERCEQASFAGGTDTATDGLVDAARECLRMLEGERL